MCVSADGNMMLSRGRDDTLKVWDMRKLKESLAAFTELDNYFETTEAIFSPGDHLFLTGSSVKKGKDGAPLGAGHVHVYEKNTLKPVKTLSVPSGSVVSLLWHQKINQLIVGTAMGQAHILYDPRKSEAGIMRAVGKQPKKADITNVGIGTVRRKREEER